MTRALTLIVTIAAVMASGTAFAADPPRSPQAIEAVSFQSGSSPLVLEEVASERPALAGWGITDDVFRGASGASLWCAGTKLLTTSGAPSFFPLYPYYGQLVQQTAEPVRLTLANPKRLTYVGFAGATVSNVVVRAEPDAGTIYKAGTHYTLSRDAQGFTTIARKGTTIANGATVYVNYRWPSAGTRTVARLPLPTLTGYYRTWLSVYYLMPSIGTADGASFSVNWVDPAAPLVTDARFGFPKTTSTGWRKLEWEMSAGENAPLSRRAGEVRFQFFDFTEASGASRNGQGAAIDDIAVSGYRYGPVRGLSATPEGAAMRLRWTKPSHSMTNPAADSRSMTYRIWRRLASASAWTELTDQRLTSTEFRDSGRAIGETYVYLIQAWDVGAGSSYGQPREWKVDSGGTVTRSATLSLSAPSTASYAAAVTVRGRLTDDAATPLPGRPVTIQQSLDGRTWSTLDAVTTDAEGAFSVEVRPTRAVHYRARFADSEFGTTLSASRRVLPRVSLTTPAASKSALALGGATTLSGYLKPRHAAGSRPVVLQAFRLEGARWVLKKSYAAAASNYSSYSRYAASVRPTAKGSWRIRAYHAADSLNAATYSGYRYITVR